MGSAGGTSLVGRGRELAAVDERLKRLHEGGGVLVVRGGAGMGKTALLDAAVARAREQQMTTLSTAGVPSETLMPYAALHRLLRPSLGELRTLAPPQRAALEAAFGLRDGASADRFLVALGVLDLLADTAADAPLLVVIDDAQWLDRATLDVLTFVGRRLGLEPILVLLAVRDPHDGPLADGDVGEMVLEGLEPAASAALVDAESPGLDPAARTVLLQVAEGNPLALVELSRSATVETLSTPRIAPIPLTERLQRAFADRASDLPEPTRQALLVAALGEGVDCDALLDAASTLVAEPVGVEVLEPAETAGLVTLDARTVRFRHPLVAAAIHQAASPALRREAHAALAGAVASDDDRCVWHRAAASTGPDESIASDLEAAAGRARARGAAAMASAALAAAAEITADPSRQGNLLVRAAEMELELGRTAPARQLLARARSLELSRTDRTRCALVLDLTDETNWSGAARAVSSLDIVGRLAATGELRSALSALLAVALRCWWGNPEQELRDRVVAAADKIAVARDDPQHIAILALADPVRHGGWALDQLANIPPDPAADPATMRILGTASTAVWADDLAVEFLAPAVDGLREQGRLGLLTQALVSQAWSALHLARETLAASAAEEAAALAVETAQPRWAVAARLAGATLAGERGDGDLAEAVAAEAEAELTAMGAAPMLALVQFCRGRSAIAQADYETAFFSLRRIFDPADPAYQPFTGAWALADLIESAVYLDLADDSQRYLTRLESLVAATPGPLLRAQLGYARPLMAPDGQVELLYEAALGRDLTKWPCYRGRLLLMYGRWLRRQRRVAESRAPLRAAREGFDALAFDGMAATARRELRATGETSRRRSPDARDQLTPQELQIAQLAAKGLSNREIGLQLYLSHRTVGSHLYRIYPKLSITSRTQLVHALAEIDVS